MESPSITYDVEMGKWVCTEDYPIRVTNRLGIYLDLLIPDGYITDLASIPRLLWRIIAPFELSIAAPLVHDFLYQNGGCRTFTRSDVDLIFLWIMEKEGVVWWRRNLAYPAVRVFGGSHWKGEK